MAVAQTEIPGRRPLDRLGRQTALTNFLIAIPFIIFFLIQLTHHELWRDELNVFGIAKASPDLRTLLKNVHYEGHPIIWYVLVWLASKSIATPVALKIVESVIGTGIILVIALKSPFSTTDKILLLLSYFVLFEYTVLSRMYGLWFLLTLVYAYTRANYPRRILLNAVLLGLMANTDVMGLILSAALAVEYATDRIRGSLASEASQKSRIVIATATYAAMVAFTVWSSRPPADISWRTTGHPFKDASSVANLAHAVKNYFVYPWMPLTLSHFPAHFWKVQPPQRDPIPYLLLPVIVLVYWRIFHRRRNLLLIIGLTSVAAIAFGHLIYMGSIRHFGITFVAFLVALWLQTSETGRVSPLARALLAISAVSGIAAAYAQWTHPFSNAGAAARWLEAHHLQYANIVGSPDTSVVGVTEEMGRPMYFLECACSDTFLQFSSRRDHFDDSEIPMRIATEMQQSNAPEAILILNRPIKQKQIDELGQRSLRTTPLAQFTGAEEADENFFLYDVSTASAARDPARQS